MNLKDSEEIWGVQFPDDLPSFLAIGPSKVVRNNGIVIALPWPPFSPAQIALARKVASDWQIQDSFVPIAGDFHDLVCLDFSNMDHPEVVIINDERTVLGRWSGLTSFMSNIETVQDSAIGSSSKEIDESGTWFDF